MKLLFILFLSVAPSLCKADITLNLLNSVFAASMYVDRMQTELIVKEDNNYYESNWWLKRHHSKRDLNLYFGGIAILAISSSYLLPDKYGKLLMIALNCIQFSFIGTNYVAGVRIFSKNW